VDPHTVALFTRRPWTMLISPFSCLLHCHSLRRTSALRSSSRRVQSEVTFLVVTLWRNNGGQIIFMCWVSMSGARPVIVFGG
jgi:hypothetical protein